VLIGVLPTVVRAIALLYRLRAMRGQIDHILDQIADILRQNKELLLDRVAWARRERIGYDELELTAPIAINGVLRDGLQARISCRSDMVECDVHAQLQVYVPAIGSYAHVQRVEWRPNRPHTNTGNANAPANLRFKKFYDRWYEFGLNRRLGMDGLRQTTPMIAQALPEIGTFNELLAFLEQVWKVSGVSRVPIPPWQDRLI
jgi:hypothetical protein